ncbi:MAG: amino acid ABC transporter permease [Lachnospiraceae bacterium]|nr:amino acid ABC transporter permease [Lachnospiraceae bacterium]
MNINIFEEIRLLATSYNLDYIFKGLLLTFELAFGILLVSFFLGVCLALLKTYGGKIPEKIITVYVEIFRNTPILLWIFICFIFMPFNSKLLRASSGLCLVSAAAICEMVRGGLNAIPKGQLEAGRSQGLNLIQIIVIIIFPQAFRRIIPNLINQMISVFKDTSFLGQVSIAEFLYCTKKIMATANVSTGHAVMPMDVFIMFGFAALIYLVINSILSAIARTAQKKLIAH